MSQYSASAQHTLPPSSKSLLRHALALLLQALLQCNIQLLLQLRCVARALSGFVFRIAQALLNIITIEFSSHPYAQKSLASTVSCITRNMGGVSPTSVSVSFAQRLADSSLCALSALVAPATPPPTPHFHVRLTLPSRRPPPPQPVGTCPQPTPSSLPPATSTPNPPFPPAKILANPVWASDDSLGVRATVGRRSLMHVFLRSATNARGLAGSRQP